MTTRPNDLDPIMILSPRDLADDMVATFREQMATERREATNERQHRYAVHRAAEVRAWELSKQYGNDTAKGKHFARAAAEIADFYHDVHWKDEQTHHVPVLTGGASPDWGTPQGMRA